MRKLATLMVLAFVATYVAPSAMACGMKSAKPVQKITQSDEKPDKSG